MDEISLALDRDDAGYLVCAIREHNARWRKFAAERTNLSDIINKAVGRLDRVADRIEKELEQT